MWNWLWKLFIQALIELHTYASDFNLKFISSKQNQVLVIWCKLNVYFEAKMQVCGSSKITWCRDNDLKTSRVACLRIVNVYFIFLQYGVEWIMFRRQMPFIYKFHPRHSSLHIPFIITYVFYNNILFVNIHINHNNKTKSYDFHFAFILLVLW